LIVYAISMRGAAGGPPERDVGPRRPSGQKQESAMICSHTNPLPDPLADPTRDPDHDPLTPPSPGHHNDEPQRPEGPPDKDPV
jgi:hypothetical protein